MVFDWQFIGINWYSIGLSFAVILIQLGILNWHWIGIVLAMDWFISGLANRTLASIEASERLAILQMNPVL